MEFKLVVLVFGACLISTANSQGSLLGGVGSAVNNVVGSLFGSNKEMELFPDPNYQGTAFKLKIAAGICYDLVRQFNNALSSIRGPLDVIIYENAVCTGRATRIAKDDEKCRASVAPCSTNLDHKASSIMVSPPAVNVDLYYEKLNAGAKVNVKMNHETCYDLAKLDRGINMDNRVQSIRSQGCVILFEDKNCRGKTLQIASNDKCSGTLTEDLCYTNMSEAASSMRLCPFKAPVRMFPNLDFNGTPSIAYLEEKKCQDLVSLKAVLRSIESEVCVEIFQNTQCSGKSLKLPLVGPSSQCREDLFSEDAPCIKAAMIDKPSSIRTC